MIKVCPICGKEFNAKRLKQVCCCRKCRDFFVRKKELVYCEFCGKSFEKFPKEIKKTKHNFCSKKCFDNFQKQENKIIILKDYAEIIINSKKHGILKIKIDIEDIEKIKYYKWQIRKSGKLFYIQSHQLINQNERKTIQLHRLIMNCPKDKIIDHINHDTLDNRKINLRICTYQQNNQNKQLCCKNSSGYRGVSYDTNNKRWTGQISINKKNIRKHFKTKEEANEWVSNKRKELMPFSSI